MMYRLIIMTGPRSGERITVERSPMIIGTAEDCAIRLDDSEIAKHHATIEHSDNGLVIKDLGSMNKVLVNNHEVREARLKHGDNVEAGRTRMLVQASVQAEVDAVEQATPPRRKKRSYAPFVWAAAIIAVVAGGIYMRQKNHEPPSYLDPDIRAIVDAMATNEAVDAHVVHTQAEVVVQPVAVVTDKPPVRVDPVKVVEDDAARKQAVWEKIGDLMAQAKEAEANEELSRADSLLAQVQALDKNYAIAYEQRAFLYERRARYKEAIGQWEHIIKVGQGTKLHETAKAEKKRLEALIAAREAAIAEPVVKPASNAPIVPVDPVRPVDPVVAGAKTSRILISGIDANKFPRGDEYDEMRAVNVILGIGADGEPPDPATVRVEVTFLDKNIDSGELIPTRAIVPREPLKPAGTVWVRNEQKTVTATYTVPKGARAKSEREGRREQYYGFVVRVFSGTKLQAQEARPTSLLQYSSGPRVR